MPLPSGFLEAAIPLIEGGGTDLAATDPIFLRCITGAASNPVGTMLAGESWPGWRLYGGPLAAGQFKAVTDQLRNWAFAGGYSIDVARVPLVPFGVWKPPHLDFRWYPWTYETERPPRWRIAQLAPLQWKKIG